MNRMVSTLAAACALSFGSVAAALCVTQETDELNVTQDPYWYWQDQGDGVRIVIRRGSSDYVFKFHITDCSGSPANVNIVEEDLLTSDPDPVIRLEIVEALDVKRISIEDDEPAITSIIEGINATGDLLLPPGQGGEAMTVDQVTGEMRFGDGYEGALLNAMTVNGDLDGRLIMDGESNGAIHIKGQVNKRMVIMGHVNQPITIDQDLAPEQGVSLDSAGIHIGHWEDYEGIDRVLNADLKDDLTVKGDVRAPIWIHGGIPRGITLKVEGSVVPDYEGPVLGIHVTEGQCYFAEDWENPDPAFPFEPEEYTDSNENGFWDPGEDYEDDNENGVWDDAKGLWGKIEILGDVGTAPDPYDDLNCNRQCDGGQENCDPEQWQHGISGCIAIGRDLHTGGEIQVHGDVHIGHAKNAHLSGSAGIGVAWAHNGSIRLGGDLPGDTGNLHGVIFLNGGFFAHNGGVYPNPGPFDNTGSITIDGVVSGELRIWGGVSDPDTTPPVAAITVNADATEPYDSNAIDWCGKMYVSAGHYSHIPQQPQFDVDGTIDIKGHVAKGRPCPDDCDPAIWLSGDLNGKIHIYGDVTTDSHLVLYKGGTGQLQIDGSLEDGVIHLDFQALRAGAMVGGAYAKVYTEGQDVYLLEDPWAHFQTDGVTDRQEVRVPYNAPEAIEIHTVISETELRLDEDPGDLGDEYNVQYYVKEYEVEGSDADVANGGSYTLTDSSAEFVSDGVQSGDYAYLERYTDNTPYEQQGAYRIIAVADHVLTLESDAGEAEGLTYHIYRGGRLTQDIVIGGGVSGSASEIAIDGEIPYGGSLQVKQAKTEEASDLLLAFSIGGPTDYAVTYHDYAIVATQPVEFCGLEDEGDCYTERPNSLWVGGKPAHEDFKFDIIIEPGASATEPKASIVLDNYSSLPVGEYYDLCLDAPDGEHFDLARLEEHGDGSVDPQLHNVVVEGDLLSTGDADPAIDLPHAQVNSIFVRGELNDVIHTDKLGLIALATLGSEFCVPRHEQPCDPLGGSGSTAVTAVTEYVRANEPVLEREDAYYFYSPDTGANGFKRKLPGTGIPNTISYYHENSEGTWILDCHLWGCAKGPVSDIDASGTVDLEDYATFAVCYGGSWQWNPETETIDVSATCDRDDLLRSDLDLNGSVYMEDFAILANQYGFGDGDEEDCGGAAARAPQGGPDLGAFQEFVSGPLWGHRADRRAWTSAVEDLIAVLIAQDGPVEEDLTLALHNLPWDACDEADE